MAVSINEARAIIHKAAEAILNDMATTTVDRAKPIMAVDTATMKETAAAVLCGSDGQPGAIYYPRDKNGRRVKRELAPLPATGELESAAVVPVGYAWPQERVNPALLTAAMATASDLPAIVDRNKP